MQSPTPSAGILAFGLTLILGGQMAAAWGLTHPDTNMFTGSSSTSGLVTAGGIAFLAGSLLVIWGAYRLASAIDLLYGDLIELKMAERSKE